MLPGEDSKVDNISAERLAEECFSKFKSLPKTGKPNNKEWTVLSGVVLYNSKTKRSKVISLGCGTKCIGKSKLCPHGLILNDSHAEVLARRGLLRYFYQQIKKSLTGSDDEATVYTWLPEKGKFKLKEEISLHFLSTQTPCGDACIVVDNETGEEPLGKKRKTEDHIEKPNVGDIIYTGAKLIGSQHTDALEQLVGAVRTKPGRGERTLSMSCSDKLAKWQIMGLQGSLLALILDEPIYFDTLNFWGGQNDICSLERAIWKRFQNNDLITNTKYSIHKPQIRMCSTPDFEFAQDVSKQPSPNGLVWCDIPDSVKPYEVSVNGKRQGITSKKINTPQAALNISKYYLLKQFLEVIKIKPELMTLSEDLDCKKYIDFKLLATEYQNAWSDVKRNYFKQWSQKPQNILEFSIRSVENKNEA